MLHQEGSERLLAERPRRLYFILRRVEIRKGRQHLGLESDLSFNKMMKQSVPKVYTCIFIYLIRYVVDEVD